MTDVQESAFGLLYNLLQNLSEFVNQEQIVLILSAVRNMIDKNLYKCEETMFENLLQTVQFVITKDPIQLRNYVSENLLDPLIRLGNYVQSPEIKHLCISILSNLLTTEES